MAQFIKNHEQMLCGGIVYEVGVQDAQGDAVDSPEEIWKCLESFSLNGFLLKKMHKGSQVMASVVESFQPTEDTHKDGEFLPAGCWYLSAKILDSALWDDIKKGNITGWSMAGNCQIEEIDE